MILELCNHGIFISNPTVDRVKHRELTTANQVDAVIVLGLTITI